MSPLTPSSEESRHCKACGQAIPPAAKLATRTVTPEQAHLLGIKIINPDVLALCLNCRIRLAELSR